MNENKLISNAFQAFTQEAPEHAEAWMEMVFKTAQSCALDEKTKTLSYLSVLAAQGLVSGVPFHAVHAKKAGVTREEVISAILIGLPAAGHIVTQSLPVALEAYDSANTE